MQADIEGAVRIATLAAGFKWTWTTDDIPRFCEMAGWSYVESPGERGADIRTGLHVGEPLALAVYDRRFFERSRRPDQQVTELVLRITDRVDGTLPENHRSLTDVFAEIVDRLTTDLGKPKQPLPGPEPRVRWSLRRVVLDIGMTSRAVELRIVNPVYRDWLDEYLSREDDEEGSGYEDDEDSDNLPDRPRTWPDLSAALALTLTRLPLSGVLVLGKADQTVAHFSLDWFGLSCRLPAGRGADAQRFWESNQLTMKDNGWSTEVGRSANSWIRSMRWPARYEEYEYMADSVVAALRNVFRISDPAHLDVRAWDETPNSYPDLTAFGMYRSS